MREKSILSGKRDENQRMAGSVSLNMVAERYKYLVAIKDNGGKWVDLKCDHYTPSAIGKQAGTEALMFRISVNDYDYLAIEIQWDNGEEDIIREFTPPDDEKGRMVNYSNQDTEDKNRRFGFLRTIDAYYMTEACSARIRRRTANLKFITDRNRLMSSRLFLAHLRIGHIISERLSVNFTERTFKALVELESAKLNSLESIQKQQHAELSKDRFINLDDLMEMSEEKIKETLEKIDRATESEETKNQQNVQQFVAKIFCLNDDLNDTPTKNEKLGKIRNDVIELFRLITRGSPDSEDVFLETTIGNDIAIQTADLFVKIAYDKELYGNQIYSESVYRIRSVIQQIYRQMHDSPNDKEGQNPLDTEIGMIEK